MGAARCSRCDVNYPYDKKKCPICDEETWRVDDDYDNDWSSTVETARLQARFAPGERRPHLEMPIVTTTEGETWVAALLLENEGVPMEPGQVILNRGKYYELVEARFLDDEETKGGWLLEHIPHEGVFDGLPGLVPSDPA